MSKEKTPLHHFERIHLMEISKDLHAAADWIDEILEHDDLHSDTTLVNSALASSYTKSVERRIQEVLDAIDIPEGESAFDGPPNERES